MSWKPLICGFAIFIALASLATADTIVSFTPSQDNTIIETSSGTLSNALGSIYAGLTAQGTGLNIRRGLVEFAITGGSVSIPANATITGGTLTMTDATTGTNNAETISLYTVSQAWGQGTSTPGTAGGGGSGEPATPNDATWLNTFYSSSFWTNPGGDFSGTLSGTANDTTNGQLVVWSGSSGSQFTNDIQNWLDSPATNHGWLLQGNEVTSKTAHQLDSMFQASPPVLTVSYTVPEPPTGWLAVSGLMALAVVKGRRAAGRRHSMRCSS